MADYRSIRPQARGSVAQALRRCWPRPTTKVRRPTATDTATVRGKVRLRSSLSTGSRATIGSDFPSVLAAMLIAHVSVSRVSHAMHDADCGGRPALNLLQRMAWRVAGYRALVIVRAAITMAWAAVLVRAPRPGSERPPERQSLASRRVGPLCRFSPTSAAKRSTPTMTRQRGRLPPRTRPGAPAAARTSLS